MSTKQDDDFFNVNNEGFEPVMVKVTKVFKNEDGVIEERGGYEFEYPYRIRIELDGNIVHEDKSQRSTFARDWSRKFYVRDGQDGRKFVSFTRGAGLLALFRILEAQGMNTEDIKPYKDNIKTFEGFEFEAVLAGNENKFIDWVKTFQHNEIEVPTLEDLGVYDAGETVKKEGDKLTPTSNVEETKEPKQKDQELPF